ncbi:Putative thiamine biosynthesis protein [Aquicella siphonis]|uniref:Thiamine biosynthesis protein n=1 Tax=Aquicella siphonis TaxID=254247 RepID=A0A5E4PII5_9COXI|nr:ABC transporter substrate-binding protein [Aquicella siphonis]VVC76223.1 Putative thiamine biosynthesis protein [Aquicella siphonis]
MKKITFLVLFLLASVIHAAEPSGQKLTVLLDWFPNPDHAPLIIAKQQGYFQEQGLEVELIGPADPTDPPKLVAAGKADIGITYEPEFMEQVDEGLPLVRVGTLIDKPLNSLVALKDTGIQSLADLKGKRIGSSNGGLTGVMLKVMLLKAGLSDKDVELTNVRYNLAQALLTHKVDAVTGIMRNYEVPLLESGDQKVVAFFPEDNGVPNYSELVFIAHTKNIHDPRFSRFLAAVKKAVAYLDKHPQQAWEGFVAQYPEANNRVNREAWFATMPYFAEDPAGFDSKEWLQFAEFMQKNQLIKKVQPVSRYAVIIR